jgi:hypothetical protein
VARLFDSSTALGPAGVEGVLVEAPEQTDGRGALRGRDAANEALINGPRME